MCTRILYTYFNYDVKFSEHHLFTNWIKLHFMTFISLTRGIYARTQFYVTHNMFSIISHIPIRGLINSLQLKLVVIPIARSLVCTKYLYQ